MKLSCSVVQDLLPNYIEDLCSEETKQQVAEHLEKCANCGTQYKEMKGELPEELANVQKEVSVEEIQPMKKIKKRHGIQIASMVVVLLLIVIGAVWAINNGGEEEYNAGFSEGYDEGSDEGYSTGYDEGSSEGYTTGYNEGYDEGSKEDENFLTMKTETDSAGEMFAELEAKMQEKWSIGEDVRVVWEDGFLGCTIRDMNLCLVDEEAMYRVRSYYVYREETLTVEVRRLEIKSSNIPEKLFRWSALVDCMETLDYDLTDDSNDVVFVFHFNENTEQYSNLLVGGEKEEEEWLYEKGELRRCDEEIQIEGNGKYYYLLLLSIHSVRDEDGDWRAEVPEIKGLYIDME